MVGSIGDAGVKAIIVAAGRGSRLQHLTRDRPKCTLELDGRSLVDRQLDIFRAVGIEDITIVTGYHAEMLQKPGVRTRHNDDYPNNNVLLSLMYAKDDLDDDVIVTYSDIVYEPAIVDRLLAAEGDILAVCDSDWERVYVGRVDHPTEQGEGGDRGWPGPEGRQTPPSGRGRRRVHRPAAALARG